MTQEQTFSYIVEIILILFVLIFIGFFIYLFYSEKPFDIFPSFTKTDKKVNWNEAYFLEYPGEIIYKIEGREANIFLRYNTNLVQDYDEIDNLIGWVFSIDNGDYYRVENVQYVDYTSIGLTSKNREFLKLLINQGPEQGLKIIAERVRTNDEGTYWLDANLHVMIGSEPEDFKAGDKRLQDLDGVIDKLNQISRGVVKSRG